MSKNNQQGRYIRNSAFGLMRGVSIVALSAAALTGAALAQEADTNEDDQEARQDTVVVTGIRGSLKRSQDIKRDSDVFVDAITASDIGALPDRSVSEALQRVPGVNVLRFAGPNDPDHFAVEGSGVIVRGLPFVRSELNGRDVFGANNSGALGFEDVSPELLGSVQVFKNQSADMVEGGLAGTIDLRTRLPFDSSGRKLAFSLEGTYSDFVEETTPSYSALWSDRWETSAGEFGLLASFAHSELKSRADATQLADFAANVSDGAGGFRPVQFGEDADGNATVIDGGTTSLFSAVEDDLFYIPRGGGIRTQDFDRERDAIALAGQWESADRTILASAQFLHSDSTLTWGERVIESSIDGGQAVQIQGTDFEFGSDNVFRSGLLSENVGWRGNGNNLPLNGAQQLNLSRERHEEESTTDYGFNVKYTPNDRWSFNIDAQYVEAETNINDVTVHGSFISAFQIDSGSDVPSFTYVAPTGTSADYFQNPDNYFIRSMMDHANDSEADGIAFRGDAEYDFSDDGFLKSVRFGARYSERDTLLRQSTFNWGNVSEIWTGSPNGLLELSDPLLAGQIEAFSFDGFQRGGTASIGAVPFWNGPLAQDYNGFLDTIRPILAAQGSFATPLPDRGNVLPGSIFTAPEVAELNVETAAIYGRLDFGMENFWGLGATLDGNIGVRYVETDTTSIGTQEFNSFSQVFLNGSDLATSCNPQNATQPGICTLSPGQIGDLQTFFGTSAQTVAQEANNSYEHFLPSLNMRWDFGEGRLVRFGASKSLIRPQTLDISVGGSLGYNGDINDPVQGNLFSEIGGSLGNPQLKPIEATQLDLSYEWYFNDTGSLTVAAFWKSLDGLWIGERGDGGTVTAGGTEVVDFTNNGVTLPFTLSTVVNANDTTTITGLELSYQQFYDMLPAPFDGLGTQFNYTYIDAEGIGSLDTTTRGRFSRDNDTFERISEHQFNLVGLYEKGPFQGRLAYNWRDEFLLTKQDVIFPFASIYQEPGGQLDASFFYDVNENIKVGFQAVNLLDDVTETTSTINPVGGRAPRAFNRNDRRYSFILRGNF